MSLPGAPLADTQVAGIKRFVQLTLNGGKLPCIHRRCRHNLGDQNRSGAAGDNTADPVIRHAQVPVYLGPTDAAPVTCGPSPARDGRPFLEGDLGETPGEVCGYPSRTWLTKHGPQVGQLFSAGVAFHVELLPRA